VRSRTSGWENDQRLHRLKREDIAEENKTDGPRRFVTYISHMPEFRVSSFSCALMFPRTLHIGRSEELDRVKGGETGDLISDADSSGESRLKYLSH
jgi:hypothetical protein